MGFRFMGLWFVIIGLVGILRPWWGSSQTADAYERMRRRFPLLFRVNPAARAGTSATTWSVMSVVLGVILLALGLALLAGWSPGA